MRALPVTLHQPAVTTQLNATRDPCRMLLMPRQVRIHLSLSLSLSLWPMPWVNDAPDSVKTHV